MSTPNRPMRPLLVAIGSPANRVLGISSRLKERLLRRGFRVQLLRNPREAIAKDSDLVFILCPFKTIDQLAEQIEQGWTKEWMTWYASHK